MAKTSIGSNAVEITISCPLFPAGVVEGFGIEGDPWVPDQIETADGDITPDGMMFRWGKNSIKGGTLTLSPASNIRKVLNAILLSQERNMLGGAVAEPQNITMVITHKHNGYISTYTDGVLTGGDIDEQVGAERLGDRTYTFKFGNLLKKDI